MTTWQGTAAETGALARRADAPADLAGRLRARHADLADLVAALATPAPPVVGVPLPGGGIAGVETARGMLFHLARLDAGAIRASLSSREGWLELG